jgi:hypothetical protein
MGCRQCQTEAFHRFDADQAFARGHNEMVDAVEAFANCLIFCLTKVMMPSIDVELDVRKGGKS